MRKLEIKRRNLWIKCVVKVQLNLIQKKVGDLPAPLANTLGETLNIPNQSENKVSKRSKLEEII
jgi:hypothetical protein